MCDRELQLLVELDNLEHVPKHFWQQNPPNSFYNLQLEPSWLLCPPRATLPPCLRSLNWPLLTPKPLQYSWNSFLRWRQRKKTSRGKTLWSYHQNCPQKRKRSWQFSAQMESYIWKHYIPYLWRGFFYKALLEGSLSALLRNLANIRADQSHSFTQLDFLQLKYFSPLALGPSKDECWISLSITHRLICY